MPEGLKGQTKWFGIHLAPKPNCLCTWSTPKGRGPNGDGVPTPLKREAQKALAESDYRPTNSLKHPSENHKSVREDPGPWPWRHLLFTGVFAVPLTSRGIKYHVAEDYTAQDDQLVAFVLETF